MGVYLRGHINKDCVEVYYRFLGFTLGFRVPGSEFRVQSSGSRFQGRGFKVSSPRPIVSGNGLKLGGILGETQWEYSVMCVSVGIFLHLRVLGGTSTGVLGLCWFWDPGLGNKVSGSGL